MNRREWKKKIYQGMEAELHHQAFELGAAWLTMEDGDPYPDDELIRMREAAREIIATFHRLGCRRAAANGRRRFSGIGQDRGGKP